jgi:hypothetical protein
MVLQTKKLGEKKWRQQKGSDAELNFEEFCNDNGISCIKLERDHKVRSSVLKNSEGKCPDFLCIKDENKIFVEVKTHTLLTNEVRNRDMKKTIQAKKAAGLSGTTIFGPFDPRPELKGVFNGYLKNASKKFKNIKEECIFPRILLLNVLPSRTPDIRAVFSGLYPSFQQDGSFAGFSKVHRGLLDSTGQSMSALIYWNADMERYECLANSRTQIPFFEEEFKIFFETSHE